MLTADTGANLRELMDRMGHSSTRAALIYLHGSDDRQQQIAASLSKLAGHELKGSRKPPRKGGNRTPSGTAETIRLRDDQGGNGSHGL